MSSRNAIDNRSSRPIRFGDHLPEGFRGDDTDAPSFQNKFLRAFEEVFEELQSLIEGISPGNLRLTVDSDALGVAIIEVQPRQPSTDNFPKGSAITRKGANLGARVLQDLPGHLNGSVCIAIDDSNFAMNLKVGDIVEVRRDKTSFPVSFVGLQGIEIKVIPSPGSTPKFAENTFVTLSRPHELSKHDFIDFPRLVARLRAQLPKVNLQDATTPEDPVSLFFVESFSSELREMLDRQEPLAAALRSKLVDELNGILRGGLSIYEPKRFAGVVLAAETLALKSQDPQGEDLIRLNRLLLEDAYPRELAKAATSSTTLAAEYPGPTGPTRLVVRDVDFARSVAESPGSELLLHAGGVPDLFNPDLTPPPQFARRLELEEYRAEPDSAFLSFLASWIGLPLRDDLIRRAGETNVDGDTRPNRSPYPRRKARWNRRLIRTAVEIYPRRGTLAGVEGMLRAWLKDDLAEGRAIVTDLLRHHTDVDAILQLGVRASVGVDTVLGEGPPFFFIADLRADPTLRGLRNPAGIDVLLREARFILETETPAHTYYQLRVRVNTMQLAAPLGQEYPGEIYGQVGETTMLCGEPFVFPGVAKKEIEPEQAKHKNEKASRYG